jgi:hypothetical protein
VSVTMKKRKLDVTEAIKNFCNSGDIAVYSDIEGAALRGISRSQLTGIIDTSTFVGLHDLPQIDDIQKEFAITQAVTYMTRKQLCDAFGISDATVNRWNNLPKVKAIIAAIRNEKRLWLLAQNTLLEKKWYRLLNRIMDHRVTGETMAVQLRAVEYVRNILAGNDTTSSTGSVTRSMTVTESVFNPGVDRDMRTVSSDTGVTKEMVIAKNNKLKKLVGLIDAIDDGRM